MGNRIVTLGMALTFVIALIAFSPATFAQAGQRGGRGGANAPSPSPPHDPHDLSGIWLQRGNNNGGPMSEWSKEALPFTPSGLAKFNENKPGKGPRAGLPAKGNDPLGDANVPGLLRTLVYGRPFQFIPLQDKTVQIFEWFRIWREIWTDGRKMPEDPGPLIYGYSVANWQGDTFVVETAGLDPRLWADEWGVPFSDELKVTERWRRMDRDNLQLTLTFNDPKIFTKPWTSDTKSFRLQTKGMPDGEMLEVIFMPMDEKDFNEKIRNPGNGVTNK
jgi:hypothetical protein